MVQEALFLMGIALFVMTYCIVTEQAQWCNDYYRGS